MTPLPPLELCRKFIWFGAAILPSAVLYEQNTRSQIWLLLRARALLHVPTWTWALPTARISVDISLYMFFHQFRILSFKNVFSWAFQLPYLFSVNLLTNCSHKSQFFIFCFWRKIQPNIWPIHPRPQFLFPFWNQRIFDLCCSHWRLIYLPHQIRSEVHHELQILPNTKLGDKNRSPPGQILRRMGYICPRPWRGLVKLKISWISNIKRNYHRSENEPLTDSYHEHFYVEKGFKVSDVLIQNLRCLKVWKFWSHRSWSNWPQWGKNWDLKYWKHWQYCIRPK